MHIKMSRSLLNQALQQVNKAVSPRTTMPILTGIKVATSKDGVIFTGSNSDITIQSLIPLKKLFLSELPKVEERPKTEEEKEEQVEIIEEGAIILPAKYFVDLIRKMSHPFVEIKTDYHFHAQITAGQSEVTLNGFDPEEYPATGLLEDGDLFTIPAYLLQTIIEETAFAVSQSETRPILTGVYWSLNNGRLLMMSTDSHRLAKREAAVGAAEETHFDQVIVPGKSLTELARLFDEQETVEVRINRNQLQARTGTIIFTTRLLEGVYPDISRIIPQQYLTEIVVSRSEFLSAIDRASLFARESEYNVVKCTLKPDEPMVITSSSQEIGQVREQIELLSFTGEEAKVAFNSRYMIEALRSMEESEVRISFTGPMSPFILHHPQRDDLLQLILPVRTA